MILLYWIVPVMVEVVLIIALLDKPRESRGKQAKEFKAFVKFSGTPEFNDWMKP